MHKRILLCLDRNQFENFNYNLNYDKALVSLGRNSGNNVFQYSLQKILTNSNNDVTTDSFFLHKIISQQEADYINNNYDCLVYSPANIISNYANNVILEYSTKQIEKLKIPVYAVGLGAQSDRFYSLKDLSNIKKNTINYIKAILKTGGKIGLRGYFTAEVVKKFGFSESDFTVIGCPSMFMNGRDLKIEKQELNENELKVAINGFKAWNNPECAKYLKNNLNSFFVCQEEFYKLLYNSKNFDWKEYQYLSDPDNKWFDCYRNNQIKLYCDFPAWYNDLINKHINFSFGCRIHGNVVPILAGIPAFIDLFDSRVKELAEYFNIPGGYLETGFDNPYDIYQKTNYDQFNASFKSKFENFKNFMNACGLNINGTESTIHSDYKLPQINNQEYISNLASKLNKPKKIAFIAHEFGLYKGHGGIASYLYNICSWLLKMPNIEIFVYASCYDKECDLLQNSRFNITQLKGSLEEQRTFVFDRLIDIQPDYIEFAEFNALGLKTVIEKRINHKLQNSTIITNNHTATKECWEWSSLQNFDLAPDYLRFISKDEYTQMQLSDYCIAPSSFLSKYVQKNYHLNNEVLVFANPYFNELKTKSQIRKNIIKKVNLEEFDNTFNIVLISRFEKRKQQERLVLAVKALIDEGLNIKLIMAGNTATSEYGQDYRQYLMSLSGDTENIYFFDFADIKAQEKFIAVADLTVMPSIFENQPVAMVETVLRDVPVMGSIYSGIVDYTKDSRLIFNPFTENDLTCKIRDFYNLSKEERIKISKEQKENLKEFLNPEKCIIDRINLKSQGIDYNYKKNMEALVK